MRKKESTLGMMLMMERIKKGVKNWRKKKLRSVMINFFLTPESLVFVCGEAVRT